MRVDVELPIRTVSEANLREHWAKKHKRSKEQRWLACLLTQQHIAAAKLYRSKKPLVITLTRIGAKNLDPDNLANSNKHVQDGVADALGIDDGSPLLTWVYAQKQGKPKQYAVEVTIEACN